MVDQSCAADCPDEWETESWLDGRRVNDTPAAVGLYVAIFRNAVTVASDTRVDWIEVFHARCWLRFEGFRLLASLGDYLDGPSEAQYRSWLADCEVIWDDLNRTSGSKMLKLDGVDPCRPLDAVAVLRWVDAIRINLGHRERRLLKIAALLDIVAWRGVEPESYRAQIVCELVDLADERTKKRDVAGLQALDRQTPAR